jgi:hypothetical protein
VFEGDVTAAANARGMYAQAAYHDKSDDQHGAGQEEDLDLFRHQTDLLYSLLRRKNACKVSYHHYKLPFLDAAQLSHGAGKS